MKATFFTSSIAKYTGVILKEHIFFLLSMFLVLSVSEQKPEEESVFPNVV
jgi:hypothetical protein